MIKAHFGITQTPFKIEDKKLLEQQTEILEHLKVHCHQRGFCIVVGDPGTGKSVIKEAFKNTNTRQVTALIQRTMHTYSNILRILCESLGIEYEGGDLKCEKQVISEAFRLYQTGKHIALLIDDAHLIDIRHLRKLRLLFEDMPNNYGIILFGQIELLVKLSLTINEDLRSRITYSAITNKLPPEKIETFILEQFERCGLAHSIIDTAALNLIARSSDGILRHAANLTTSAMLQAVRKQTRTIETPHVNTALMQPHWRDHDHWILKNEE